jgi:hypothetical protein
MVIVLGLKPARPAASTQDPICKTSVMVNAICHPPPMELIKRTPL